MNGLLDYLKQGQTALTNATGMDWNKIQADPGANAQALMGGQAMQYNQQPQSLLSNVYGKDTDTFKNETGIIDPKNITPQQTQQMTYQGTPQAGVDYPNYDSSAINPYLDGDQTDGTGGYVDNSYNNRIAQPQTGSMLMGPSQQQKGIVGVDSTAPIYNTLTDERDYSKEAQVEVGQPQVSVGGPFDWLNSLLSPNIDREELIRRGIIPPK